MEEYDDPDDIDVEDLPQGRVWKFSEIFFEIFLKIFTNFVCKKFEKLNFSKVARHEEKRGNGHYEIRLYGPR